MVENVWEAVEGLPLWIQIPAILAAALIGAKLVETGSYYILHRSERLATGEYDKLIVEELQLPLYLSVILGGVYVSVQLLPEPADRFALVEFVVISLAISILIVVWARAIIRVVNRVISVTNESPTDREITPIVKNVLAFFVILAAFFVLLAVWRVDVTPLLASAGILGIILGIAAQDSLGNFFGGLSLYFDKTYKLGDMIQLESGERGTVIDISIRSTTILTRDNIAITVPNAEMNSKQVINESAPVRRRRIRLDVGVAYGSDLETVEHAILDAAAAESIVLDSPRPKVRFQEFDDSAIVAQLQCYIAHPGQRGEAYDTLIRRIDERFDDEEVKIPFPQRELSFLDSGNRVSVDRVGGPVTERRPQQEGHSRFAEKSQQSAESERRPDESA